MMWTFLRASILLLALSVLPILFHLSAIQEIFSAAIAANCSTPTPNNPFAGNVGQCTWYVWERRHEDGEDLPVNPAWGNAKDWTANAATAGWPTGNTPRVGAIVVCQPGACGGADAVNGHVGYVEGVNSPTSFIVSEMNWPDTAPGCVVRYRTASTGTGVSFIYKKSPVYQETARHATPRYPRIRRPTHQSRQTHQPIRRPTHRSQLLPLSSSQRAASLNRPSR
jgi:surface antigen